MGGATENSTPDSPIPASRFPRHASPRVSTTNQPECIRIQGEETCDWGPSRTFAYPLTPKA